MTNDQQPRRVGVLCVFNETTGKWLPLDDDHAPGIETRPDDPADWDNHLSVNDQVLREMSGYLKPFAVVPKSILIGWYDRSSKARQPAGESDGP